MLVETDTDPSAIDLATAKVVGLAVVARSYAATGGGTGAQTVQLTRLPSVELGTIIAKDVVAGAIDLKKLSDKFERPIQGVLGYTFLKERIIQIDDPDSKLRFFAESPYAGIQNQPNTVNKIAMPFRYDNGVLIDSVFINGQKLSATLDPRSRRTCALTPDA